MGDGSNGCRDGGKKWMDEWKSVQMREWMDGRADGIA